MTSQKTRKKITFETIAEQFGKPLEEAAQALQISSSSLKRVCREYNIRKWPFRKVSESMNVSILMQLL